MDIHYAYIDINKPSHDLSYLWGRGVKSFVHFTAAENLESILRNGIMPRAVLDETGTRYTSTDSLRLEGSAVINLSITNPNIKMFYGKRRDLAGHLFAVLTLDPSLLNAVEGNYSFRSTNAASRFSQPCSIEEVFAGDRPNFFDKSWPTDNQAEVLVGNRIDPVFIRTIQFPFNEMGNSQAVKMANSTAELVKQLGLQCSVLFCNQHFDYNKTFLGQLEPRERYERFYISWAENEHAAIVSEEVIKLTVREKAFDSVAIAADLLNKEIVEPDKDVRPDWVWTLRYRSPAEAAERNDSQLSAFAVIEKIINRSRITRLSHELEKQLGSDVEIAAAHQAQCSFVELIKHQTLRAKDRIAVAFSGNRDARLEKIVELALRDLQGLSASVCKLYGCNDLLEGICVIDNGNAADLTINWSDDASELADGEARVSSFKQARGALPFDFTRVVKPVTVNPDIDSLRFLLNYTFGFKDFREGQLEAIRRGLRRQDTIVLLPTGSGKSIVYQLLSLITPGIAFVVCPIISLIEDQISNLRQAGIDRVVGLSSAMDGRSRSAVLGGITAGQYLICYVAPERFQNRSFNASVRRYASTNLISTIAIDEAHCVSEWGHEFRTSYLGLARTCREVCSTGDAIPPLLALTGTASISVLTDMKNDLEINDEFAIIQPTSFDRPEIHYRVIRVPSNRKLHALNQVVDVLIPNDFQSSPLSFYSPNGEKTNCGIVFCPHVNGSCGIMATDKALAAGYPGVWDYLQACFPGLCSYYSGSIPKRIKLSDSRWNMEKRAQAASFKGNRTTIMVATKAFGMGIDKPNVRWIVHFGMPDSLESYYQEVGRAARDRNTAYAYLLLSDDFHDLNEELLDPSRTPFAEMESKNKSKGEQNHDDISWMVRFHLKTFSGAESELKDVESVLNACTQASYQNGHWHIVFDDKKQKESKERAIHRLRVLGVFDGYAVDFQRSGGVFVVKPSEYRGKELRDHIVNSYLDYITAYQPDKAYFENAKKRLLVAVNGARDDRDYILRAMRQLLVDFVYSILEIGRRNAARAMMDAANIAADAGGGKATDDAFRRQILAFLSTNEQVGKQGNLRQLLNDATNLNLILELLKNGTKEELLGQTARLLEDYPEHYGLYFIQAAIYALDGSITRSSQSLRLMTKFGMQSYGLSRNTCRDNFVKFMNDSIAKSIQAEDIDQLLPAMCDCFGCEESKVLSLLKTSQATMLKRVNSLYEISVNAMEGLRWIRQS